LLKTNSGSKNVRSASLHVVVNFMISEASDTALVYCSDKKSVYS